MKVPEPRKLPSGSYNVRLNLGGEFLSITCAKPEECKAQARLIKSEYLAGKRQLVSRTAKNYTLREAQDEYIKTHKAVLSPATVRSYTIYARTRFKAYQNKKLADIDFQKIINEELEVVSEKTVKNAWGLIRPALDNIGFPVPSVRLAKAPINEIAFLMPDEIKPFLTALKGKSYEIPVLMLLHGLRMSEVRGMQWENVDLKNNLMTVHGALVRGENGNTLKMQNKNETSTRSVPILIPRLAELLKQNRQPSGAVARIGATTLLDDVKRNCKHAGVTIVTPHGLRHSFASLCYYLQIPDRQIQEWGGWKDSTTLHRVYIRIANATRTESAKKVTGFFTKSDTKIDTAIQDTSKT